MRKGGRGMYAKGCSVLQEGYSPEVKQSGSVNPVCSCVLVSVCRAVESGLFVLYLHFLLSHPFTLREFRACLCCPVPALKYQPLPHILFPPTHSPSLAFCPSLLFQQQLCTCCTLSETLFLDSFSPFGYLNVAYIFKPTKGLILCIFSYFTSVCTIWLCPYSYSELHLPPFFHFVFPSSQQSDRTLFFCSVYGLSSLTFQPHFSCICMPSCMIFPSLSPTLCMFLFSILSKSLHIKYKMHMQIIMLHAFPYCLACNIQYI